MRKQIISIEEKRIAVLMGGVSNEREISLASGRNVLEALKDEGLNVVGIDVVDEEGDNLKQALEKGKIDIAFIALHGCYGEDGRIQSFLEKLSIPYTGSGVIASATCFNKYISKQLLGSCGISTPPFCLMTGENYSSEKILGLGFPLVVKPCSGGSAIGVSIVKNEKELKNALGSALEHDSSVIMEKYIPGKEITVSIIGNHSPQVLPIIEIVPKCEFYDYAAKYEPGMSEHILPARLSADKEKEAGESGILAYRMLGCSGFARVDMIAGEDGTVYVLEINTIPGLTGTSLFPEAAKAAGLTFGKMCIKLIEMVDE